MQNLLIILLTGMLVMSCSAVSTDDNQNSNFQESSASIGGDSWNTSIAGTTLTFARTYQSRKLLAWLDKNEICPTGLNSTVCASNMAKLRHRYKFVTNPSAMVLSKAVDAYIVKYHTEGVHGEDVVVSGGIIVPKISPKKIKGIVLYYHPMEISKHQVPSCFYLAPELPEYCDITKTHFGSSYGLELGAIFAAHGYIVVMPDYIGQGLDNANIHPFVMFPEINAMSGLNMLAATRLLIDHLGSSKVFNLYVSGFSEGGAYALWATKLLQDKENSLLTTNKLKLKATAAISGMYDLQNAQLPMYLANETAYPEKNNTYHALSLAELTVKKAIMTSYILTAYANYAADQSYSDVFNTQFLQMHCGDACLVWNNQYKVDQLYNMDNQLDIPTKTLTNAIVNAAFNTNNADNNENYGLKNNSISALINPDLLRDRTFIETLSASAINTWQTTTKILLIYLDYDSVVTNMNTKNAYDGISSVSDEGLVKSIPVSNFDFVTYKKSANQETGSMSPIDHVQSAPFLLIVALNEFNKNQ